MIDEDNKVISEDTKEELDLNESNDSKKDKKQCKWKDLPKKKKIIIITSIVLGVIIIAIILFFLLKKDKVENNKVEEVTVENQNYRYQNGTLYFYDKEKNEIGTYECKNKDEEKCYLVYYTLDEDVDNTKYVYEDDSNVSFQTPIVSNKYVFVYDNSDTKDEVIRLYNFKEQKEVDVYQEVKKANDDYTFILKNTDGLYGIISLKDDFKQIVDFKYNYLGYYDESKSNKYIAFINDKYYIIDDQNKEVSRPIKERIVGYNDTFIKVKGESKYHIYDYKGVRKFDSSYDFVSFLINYVLVVNKDSLYILDKEGNNLNIDGLKLNNKYYCKTYIYDSNKKLLKIVNSYEASLDGNNIIIDIYNGEEKENHVINALEASVNSKSENISYIDGKLYFYDNLEKTNKIGSYTCKNKNNITSEDSELSSCYLAKQKDGSYLPIINGRYVFINDTLDINKQAIVLYDLKDNKVLSNYLEVESTINTDNRLVSSDALNIIAKSAKKDRYGMIRIAKDSVTSLLDFSNQSITKLSDYYVANKSSGTYILYDNDGKALSGEFADEIISYNSSLDVVMVSKNNKYNLYKSNGDKLTSKGYERIDVYPKYIVGIDNKSLDVINYEGKPYCQNCSNIKLFNDDYNDAYNIDDFKVTIYNGSSIAQEITFAQEEELNGEE